MIQPPWMPHAWSALGISERAGPASDPTIVDFFRRVGHASIKSDETAWCAAFIGASLERAGLRSTRSLAARSYLDWGVATDKPQLGVITVLSRSADPALGHVGFLVGMTGDKLILLGGNQSDAVTVAAFDRTRLLGFRLPSPATVRPREELEPPSGSQTHGSDPGPAEPEPDVLFRSALARVLEFEGGWSDDRFDPGGPTNKGITLATFAREKGVEVDAANFDELKAELRRIPDDLLARIYRERYWRPSRAPDLPPALALFHFDAAVNQGVPTAARLLQEALSVTIDGEIGPETLAAADARPLQETLALYAEIRRRRYRSLAHFWRFGRGWLRRVDAMHAHALALAGPSPEPPRPLPSRQEQESPRMPAQETLPTPPPRPSSPAKWWGESLTIWGAIVTALSTVLPPFAQALGLDITADLVQALGRDIVLLVQSATGLAGTVMTILGRVRASTRLERRPVSLHF